MSRVDVLTQIQDKTFPNFSGTVGSVAVTPVRSGNTWTLPMPLAAYPRGNRVNAWRIRIAKPPPADVTYYKSIKQTFVQAGAPAGVFEPRTTR